MSIFVVRIASILSGCWLWENLPETKGSFKHTVKHLFWMNSIIPSHYYNHDGENISTFRCVVCDTIDDDDIVKYGWEDENFKHPTSNTIHDALVIDMSKKQDLADKKNRLIRRKFEDRFGDKSHYAYLEYLKTEKLKEAILKSQIESL